MHQLIVEEFGRGSVAEAFSGSLIVPCDEQVEMFLGQLCGVGFPWQGSSEPSDGVFDASLLPGCVFVAEVGFDVE